MALVIIGLAGCATITAEQHQEQPLPRLSIDITELKVNAKQTMQRYLEVALHRFRDDKEVQLLLLDSQRTWDEYQSSHCQAVYRSWQSAGVQREQTDLCDIELMQQRTLAIWRSFLTFEDSTTPLLPKPN